MKESTFKLIRTVLLIMLIAGCSLIVVKINVDEVRKDAIREKLKSESEADGKGTTGYFSSFELSTSDGGSFTEKNLSDFRVNVINCWGNTCPSCIREMPFLQELYDEYKEKGLQVVGVSADTVSLDYSDDDYETARKIIVDNGVTYPCLFADSRFDSEVFDLLNGALPGTFFTDAQGNVIRFVAGSHSKEEWTEMFNEVLSLY